MLGGGASSRLFHEVREERGLAYSVYSSMSSYSDCGLATVYAGTLGGILGLVLAMLMSVRPADAVLAFADTVDVLTFDHEHVPGPHLAALEQLRARYAGAAWDALVNRIAAR